MAQPVLPTSDPLLTPEDVIAAYESLRRAASYEGNPLLGFSLVHDLAGRNYHAFTIDAIEAALHDLLFDLIHQALQDQRLKNGLPPDPADTSRQEALQAMQNDIRAGVALLAGFSYIHYHYVRYDLDFAFSLLDKELSYVPRTRQRLLADTWDYLRRELVQRELAARVENWQTQARLALPARYSLDLPSQQTQVQFLLDHMLDHASSHVLLAGERGAGKSTIALKLAQELIDRGWIHHAMVIALREHAPWLTPLDFIEELCSYLPVMPSATPALNRWKAFQAFLVQNGWRLLIVLEDIDQHHTVIHGAWAWLSACVIIATSTKPTTDWLGYHYACQMPNQADSLALARAWDSRERDDSTYITIIEYVKHNPSLLRQVITLVDTIPLQSALSQTLARHDIESRWHQLAFEERWLWVMLHLMSETGTSVSYEDIHQAAPSMGLSHAMIDEGLNSLNRQHLLAKHIQHEDYRYLIEARIANVIHQQASFRDLLQMVLERQAVHLWSLRLIELGMAVGLPVERLGPVFEDARHEVILGGKWHRWRQVLEKLVAQSFSPTSLSLQLEQAIAFRWMGQLKQALQFIEDVVLECRRVGKDDLLIDALIEQSTILFYLDDNQRAWFVAEDAYQLLEVVAPHDIHRYDRCVVALAQSLRKNDPETALDWMQYVRQPDAKAWDLIARLQIDLRDAEAALHAAQIAVKLTRNTDDHPAYARALGIYARALGAAQNFERAIAEFATAINLLQSNQDVIGLTRMYINHGIACARYAESHTTHTEKRNALLSRAEESVQRALELLPSLEDSESEATAHATLVYIQELRTA